MNMKINRLLEITIILLNRGTVTAKELAGRFGVSTRTILRDIDVLSCAGIPVFTNKGSGGGISLMENYSLNKILLSDHESESLILALKTLQATKYPEIDMILDKIGSMFKNTSSGDWVHIDFSHWGSKPNEYNKFINIKRAILERRIISFDYVNADGKRSHRTIEPMQLTFKSQAWYLWGYCKVKHGFRIFRISRIKNMEVIDQSFERRVFEDKPKEEQTQTARNMVNLKLRFSPEVIHRIYDDFDDELIIKNPDGTFDVNIAFPEDEWVYGYILSFGCFVQVMEPQHIKDTITNRMKKALEFYVN
jgi:predicted DNA-binding transcriptional regulator YafY